MMHLLTLPPLSEVENLIHDMAIPSENLAVLTSNPTLADLLVQARGERIEVVSYGEQGKKGQPTTLTGVIVVQ